MIAEPNCAIRKCVYFLGVYQPDDTEMTETVNCQAYPEGIPDDIAYGADKHLKVRKDQKNTIVFQAERRK